MKGKLGKTKKGHDRGRIYDVPGWFSRHLICFDSNRKHAESSMCVRYIAKVIFKDWQGFR